MLLVVIDGAFVAAYLRPQLVLPLIPWSPLQLRQLLWGLLRLLSWMWLLVVSLGHPVMAA